jgi:hypothetical protein
VLAPGARQHLLDQALVVRVGELRVAAQRVVLHERDGIVGVVAVGRAAAGIDELLDPRLEAGSQHVLGAEHVDRVLELACAALGRRHDRREVRHRVAAPALHPLAELGIPDVAGLVADAGQPLALGHLAQIERHHRADALAILGELRHQASTDQPGGPRDEHRAAAHAPGSRCMALKTSSPGAHMWATGSTSTWITEQRPLARLRSIAPRRSAARETRRC